MLLLSFGTLFARPEDRHLRILFARTMAGMLARRLLLGVAIVPLGFSVVLTFLVRQEWITMADGVRSHSCEKELEGSSPYEAAGLFVFGLAPIATVLPRGLRKLPFRS